MGSICNDERVRLGVVSGHDRKALSLSDLKSIFASGWGPELIPDDDILQSQFPQVLAELEQQHARLVELQALFAAASEEGFEDTDDTGALPADEVKTLKDELKEATAEWKAQLKTLKGAVTDLFTEFTDSHAYYQWANYYSSLDRLDKIDWPILQARDFKRDPDDPAKFERCQAEALVHQHMPVSALLGVVCYIPALKQNIEQQVAARGLKLAVHARPGWYF